MSTSIAIIKNTWFHLIRSKSELLLMVGLPLVFTFVFGVVPNMTSSQTHLAVVDEDHSRVSAAFIRALSHDKQYDVRLTDMASAQSLMRHEEISDIMILPKRFGTDVVEGRWVSIPIQPSPNAIDSDGQTQADIQNTFQHLVSSGTLAKTVAMQHGARGVKLTAAFVNGTQHPQAILKLPTVVQKDLDHSHVVADLSRGQQSVVGFATMFIIFAVFGQTDRLFGERRSGTWDRLKISGASRTSIVAGYGSSLFLIGWMQFLILYIFGTVMFGIELPFSWSALLIVSLYILAISGVALCLQGVVKTEQQQGTIGMFIAIVTSMLGGAYWPLDIEPTWMQHVGWFVPQNWAISAFREIVVGGGFQTLVLPMGVLAAFAVVFFTAGIAQLRYT